MKLSELIAAYGDDTVQFQNLDESTEQLDLRKDGFTRITFVSEQLVGLNGTDKLGLVVWLDRERAAEIVGTSKQSD